MHGIFNRTLATNRTCFQTVDAVNQGSMYKYLDREESIYACECTRIRRHLYAVKVAEYVVKHHRGIRHLCVKRDDIRIDESRCNIYTSTTSISVRIHVIHASHRRRFKGCVPL